MRFKSLILPLLIAGITSSCSFGTFDPTGCDTARDCRDIYGWGSTCASDGFCHTVEVTPACKVGVFPRDFFDNPEDYIDYIPIGLIYNSLLTPADFAAVDTAFKENPSIDQTHFALLPCVHSQGANQSDDIEANVDFLAETIGVSAIIGGFDSESTMIAFTHIQEQEYDTLLFTPSSTSPRLATAESHVVGEPSDSHPGLLWRLMPDIDVFGEVMAEYVVEQLNGEEGTIAIVYELGVDGEALKDVVFETFEENNISVNHVGAFQGSTLNDARSRAIEDALTDAADGTPIDWLLVLSSQATDYTTVMALTDTVDFINSAEYNNARFLFPPAARAGTLERETATIQVDPSYERHLGRTADGDPMVIGVAPYIDTSPQNSAYTSFKDSFGRLQTSYTVDQSGFAAHAYDTAWMVMYATAWAYRTTQNEVGAIRGSTVGKGLRRLHGGSGFNVGLTDWDIGSFELLKDGNSTINLDGASGDLAIDLDTEEISIPPEGYPIELWGLVGYNTEGCMREDGGTRDDRHCIVPLGRLQ